MHLKYGVRDVISLMAIDAVYENERYSYITLPSAQTGLVSSTDVQLELDIENIAACVRRLGFRLFLELNHHASSQAYFDDPLKDVLLLQTNLGHQNRGIITLTLLSDARVWVEIHRPISLRTTALTFFE